MPNKETEKAHDMERVHFISYDRIKSFVYVLQLTATKEQHNYARSASTLLL